MTLAQPVHEKRGEFYLGRLHDLASNQTSDSPLLYESAQLATHAVCVGMTGSGKTGLCVSLLEEAALDGIPAIAIDPKGDLGNLLLTFPELKPGDFRPWIDPSEAVRQGATVDALAEKTAATWAEGLARWGQDGERIRRFTQAVDRAIYTPGSSAGLPLTILKSFNAPPAAVRNDADALGDRVQAATSGVLALLGVDADPLQSREHILLSKVLDTAWRAGRDLDLPAVIQEIQRPPFNKIGVVDIDSFFPAAARHELGMRLNNLLASPSFAAWLEGEPLDVERLLYTPDGRPRLSILSIAHLNDSERMFFVTLLLNEVISWMRAQPGTGSLRALLYMDEVFGFFPPTANPPAKRPMLTLLKQSRAFGVGCVLATQNPVDIDYKGLSNAGTWWLGRLQTERDKARVIEGLEGASVEAGAQFDRGRMESTLARLGKRVFVMNNVHKQAPEVFHTRWALSYLAGPLTRGQISTLMADRKVAAAPPQRPSSMAAGSTGLPLLSAEIEQRFLAVDEPMAPESKLEYRPSILGAGRIHFVETDSKIDVWQSFAAVQTANEELSHSPWADAAMLQEKPRLAAAAEAEAVFFDVPRVLTQPKTYERLKRELREWVYQSQRLVLWKCADLDEWSRPMEGEGDYRQRMAPIVKAQRTSRAEKEFAVARQRLEKDVQQAVSEAAESRWWLVSLLVNVASRVAEIVLSGLLGRRSRKQAMTATIWNQAMRQRRAASQAKATLKNKRAELAALDQRRRLELDRLDVAVQPASLEIEKVEVPPRKSDIDVDEVLLAWLPWRTRAGSPAAPAYSLPGRSRPPSQAKG